MWEAAKTELRDVGAVLMVGIMVICVLYEWGGEVCRWIYEVAK